MTKRKEIKVQDITISWRVINDEDYISLTDIARKYNEKTDVVLQSWMRNGSTVEFLGLWEQLRNPNFNSHGFAGIKNRVGFNNFYLSVKEWVKETNAIGIQARTGRYGGTFAHKDIVFEFASWIDVKFKLYLILEFQRLKEAEASRQQVEWDANRFLELTNTIPFLAKLNFFKGEKGKFNRLFLVSPLILISVILLLAPNLRGRIVELFAPGKPKFKIINRRLQPDSDLLVQAVNWSAKKEMNLDLQYDKSTIHQAGKFSPTDSLPYLWVFPFEKLLSSEEKGNGIHFVKFQFSGGLSSADYQIIINDRLPIVQGLCLG